MAQQGGSVTRIRVSPSYTNEIGALLGIIVSEPANIVEAELKPVIKASPSLNGFKFNVDVTRLGMTAFKVQIQRKGSDSWQDAAFATNSPVEVTVTPTSPGEPERIMVRAVLIQKNEPVGIPSDPTFVTVNP